MRLTSLFVGFAAMLSIAAAGGARADAYSGDGGVPAFYHLATAVPATPGKLIAIQPLAAEHGLPSAGSSFLMLYSSRSVVDDAPMAVSGAIYLPKGPPPAGGWPIIAWAHPTVGVADVCAPSYTGASEINSAYLDKWLSAGFAVVATDYEGLGTPGRHPYLNYRSEGRGVLDSVRAALAAKPALLANVVIPTGHSQGSGAAIGAAYMAKDYAPDLKVMGAVATGLVIQVNHPGPAPQLAIPAWGDDPKIAAFDIMYFLGLHRSFEPTLSVEDWVSDRAMPLVQAAMQGCWSDVVAAADQLQLKPDEVFKRDISDLRGREDEYAYLADGLISVPVFTAIGLSDQTAGLEGQYNFVSAACAAGSAITWRYYPRITHRGVVPASFSDSLAFAQAILGGKAPASNCTALEPPGPLQSPDLSLPGNGT